jgi:hypothetical protein
MNHLLSMAMLLMTLAPQNQNLPKEFYQIPEQIRERATVVVTGTFGQGRTPCEFRPDGTRVWYIDSWFDVTQVYRGKVGHKSIRVNTAMLPVSRYVSKKLQREQNYLVLLRPDEETAKAIKTAEGLSFWNSLHDEEIIAIVELK